jgi:hypothetical protein
MNPAEEFVMFAAECESMAKFTHTPENKALWKRMAERWLRCAELYDRQNSATQHGKLTKRQRTPGHGWAQ